MTALTDIKRFLVPEDLVELTLGPIREAGERGYEAFVLWGGRVDGDELSFESGYVPEQHAMRTRSGLLVTVEGEALFKANKAFFDNGLILAGQVHSHPTEAFHSEVDDENPLMTLVGGVSGVIPAFGEAGSAGFADWAWYRLAGESVWQELEETEVSVDLV